MEETKETTKKTTTTKKAAPKSAAKKTTAKKTTTKAKVASTTSSKSEKINVTATPKKESKTTKESTNVTQEIDAFAAISLILGFASMITWLYPLLGVAVAIPGLSIGIVTHETKRSNYSLIGIVMSLVGIILSIIKAFSA